MSASDKAFSVVDCVERIKAGTLSSETLVQAFLDIIHESENDIGAWAHLDKKTALDQARKMDEIRRHGRPTGALHGIPVGVKDIFDTVDYPTQLGSAVFSDRQPDQNCAVVEKLCEAGAVIMGKTVTTEVAYMHPADTHNPHNLNHSPGGSSSGSAAAVAAGHVPLAIGSQTGGSVIRPASFCGVYGFKPSRGVISRRGVLQTSQSLDQVGIFAQNLADMALLSDVLSGFDNADELSYLAPRPEVYNGFMESVPVDPVFAWFDLPYADRFSADMVSGFDELIEALGGQVDRIPAPQSFVGLLESHRIIYGYEIFRCTAHLREAHMDSMSDTFKNAMSTCAEISADQYEDARAAMSGAEDWFSNFFNDYDAVLTPSAIGQASLYNEGTGDPVCCNIWTLAGLPCASLPLLASEVGLPIGVQLVAGLNEDNRLFRTMHWLSDYIDNLDS